MRNTLSPRPCAVFGPAMAGLARLFTCIISCLCVSARSAGTTLLANKTLVSSVSRALTSLYTLCVCVYYM